LIRRSPAVLLLLALAVLVVAGCGSKEDRITPAGTDRLRVMLDFFPNADHVGLYAAQREGMFHDAGLNVELQPPPDPSAPLKLLQAGKVDLAISYEPELLLARDKGAPLVAVASVVQRPLTSLISVAGSKVKSPKDLSGKVVGTAGIPYQSAYLKTIAKRAGVAPAKVKQVNVGFNLVPAMLSNKVYATLGGFWNYEGVQLRLKKKKPSITRVDQAGVPTYSELVLVARQATLTKNTQLVRRFAQALGRGYEFVRRNPSKGVADLIAANPDLKKDAKLQTASVRATLPAFFPAGGKPWGFSNRGRWQAYGQWMFTNKLVTRQPAAAGAVTNEFLAGQGE
jgi:putative hydroxymethylpyrimidine transport system substrate-binding protein